MGFFKAKASEPPDDTCREYLAKAPPGARTEVLAAACMHHLQSHPVAQAAMLGRVITYQQLYPAAEMVRMNLSQDRDLSAHVLRQATQHLDVVLNGFLAGSFTESLAAYYATAGMHVNEGDIELMPECRAEVGGSDAEAAVSLMRLRRSVFHAFFLGREKSLPQDWTLWEGLHTRKTDFDAEALAYELIALDAIMKARLANAGCIGSGYIMLQKVFASIPVMSVAGWYPNPTRVGGLVDGLAVLQRYWDGTSWTSQARQRDGQGWRPFSYSLHEPPPPDPSR